MKRIQYWARVLDQWPLWLAFSVVTLVWGFFYLVSNHVNLLGKVPQTLFIDLDLSIPFVDWTLVVYLSVFIQLPIGMWWLMTKQRGATVVVGSLITIIHFIFFVVYPTILPRVGLEPTNAFWVWAYNLQWSTDNPVNCFPSLHVGAVALLSFCAWRENKRIGIIFTIWSLTVAISTLTTKQHYVVDLAGGYASAALIYYFLYRKIRRPI